MNMPGRKLIAVVGATASGKTAMAIEIARALGGGFEAVNADSRQVYRFMDIGTAKATAAERESLPHHLLDVVYPDESFGLATWLAMANEALTSIWGAGHVPIVVGGTGQYVWALLEGWRVPEVPPQEDFRREMEGRPAEDLVRDLQAIDPESQEYVQPQNVRRVIRALEVHRMTGKPLSYWRTKEPPSFDWLAIGRRFERRELYRRIDARVDAMIGAGLAVEVRGLLDMGYGPEFPSMSGIGYGEMCAYFSGEFSLAEATARTKTHTHRFVRHQNAWFKAGDSRIRWIEGDAEAVEAVRGFLSSTEQGASSESE